ncbi:hypothetical protein ARAF_0500 [Arsenophonus endosymbiont of Aleurodicus floccissimus]|uniref:hypothetical protein n=1 Tax=Arsenophonus endosymbiont of Aleurodicus floccissimus TaxID=2152761 RepID=UPI000E6B2C8A|nr:hypothetical protein [Arsenophonus endosymbiont of Aleurodicus floccissimus]SPP31376.1 hypothetical protein ARAF_0500 [Arsenophonus endosymbiont of Aleurodicus floccissimus]
MATIIFKPKKDNAKSRRRAKQMAFWDRKRAKYEAKPKPRTTEQIIDSIFNKQDDTVNAIASLTFNLKDKKPQPSFDNCCLPKSALYSVKNRYRYPILESKNLIAKV